MSTDFKYTGHPQPAHTANIAGSGVVIAGPGASKYITIFDVLASESTIAYIPSGATNLGASITGGIDGGTGNAILNTAGNVTITYTIQTASWI